MDPQPIQGCVCIEKKLRRNRQKQLAVDLIQDFAQNTTLHGLRYIVERGLSIIEKIFWIAAVATSLSMCTMLIWNVWEKWQTSPVLVALSEHLVPVREVPFPSVTICPQIKAQRSVYNFSHEAVRVFRALADSNLTQENIKISEKFEDIGIICWLQSSPISPLRDFADAEVVKHIIEVSPKMSDVFVKCMWRHEVVKCEELFSPVLTSDGLCFAMNTLASSEMFREENIQKDYSYLNTSTLSKDWTDAGGYTSDSHDVYPRRGRENSARADLQITLREKAKERDGLCNGINHGFKVYLQHPSDMPQASLFYYAALPQRMTSFALKFSILNTSDSLMNYPPETRQCFFPGERSLKYFSSYTGGNCRLECQSNYTFELCGCVWFHMPHDDGSTICREAKRKCVISALEKYAYEEGRTSTEFTRCRCHYTCGSVDYDAATIVTDFDEKRYNLAIDELIEGLPDTSDNHDGYEHSQINMYYKESRFISMRRSELFGLTDFMANCGGLLGLFLGFSFLSLVEIAYFLTLRLGCTLRRNAKIADSDGNKADVTRM